MTKGGKTALFMLIATVANILATAVAFVLILVLYGLTLGRVLKLESSAPVIIIAFIGSIVLAGFAYKKALDWANKKWHLEEKLGLGRRDKRRME